jgi:glycosyltransferase involved in cell wall biosynthesis
MACTQALSIRILGSRGIPARHGGFETFSERLAIHLVSNGWDVTVYCQADSSGQTTEDTWRGVRRVHIPVETKGPLGTIIFDWRATLHAARKSGPVLTLGYNTAVFTALYRFRHLRSLINMDGIEWKRKKWPPLARAWFYLNERLGCHLGNVLIADHPAIQTHLASRVSRDKIVMIPYGADEIVSADVRIIDSYGLRQNEYALVIARLEPENSILEIVTAFSRRNRCFPLVIVGDFTPDINSYHRKIKAIASAEVRFLGSTYDTRIVSALRYCCRLYIHGHSVGGTNPSLVEALGAGNAVLGHDNRFNRWVAGQGANYFKDTSDCSEALDRLLDDGAVIATLKEASRKRHSEAFQWPTVLLQYERLLAAYQK